ncbi:MAG: DUF484 family protein [Pseudomonadota bacterium]
MQDVTVADASGYASLADLHVNKSVYCGPASTRRINQFFPDTGIHIRSIAIIKLQTVTATNGSDNIGYLALASNDKSRFAPHMATDFLQRFGELLSARLAVFYN